MKGAILLAAAASLLGSAAAGIHKDHQHAHEKFHHVRRDEAADNATYGCTTYVTTYLGAPTLFLGTTTLSSTTYTTVTVSAAASTSAPAVVPTPEVTTFPTPGTYTLPASTITLTEETTVGAATTTALQSGSETYGGVTTVVETATTIVCPYATVSAGSTLLETTTYVCPSAGTYTIAPTTTYVSASTVLVYPTPASYAPGTYTQPETTITVVETDFVYYCPFATSTTPVPSSTEAAASTSAAASTPTSTTTSIAPAVFAPASSPSSASSYSAAASPVSSAAASPSTSVSTSWSSSAPAPSSGSSTIGSSGDHWCMTYSPYTASGGCKDAGSISSDIADIASKGFSSVRLYSTDCDGLSLVGSAARSNGLKLVLGVYISNTGISGAQPQVDAIAAWAQWDLVELIVIGNEALFNSYCTASELAGFIASAKGELKAVGYTGPFTTTDTVGALLEHGSGLCSVLDVIAANIHGFFSPSCFAWAAGAFVAGQLLVLEGICPGLTAYNLETGWPTAGQSNGDAVPGWSEQAQAIGSIRQAVGGKCAFFSYENDLWKQPGEFEVEQSWGCAGQFAN